MRLFVALELPDDWKNVLSGPEKDIGWLSHGIKWVEPRGMHLTLKFLGEVDPSRLNELLKELSTVCTDHETFDVKINGTGVFPNRKRPRVFWAGVEAPETLTELQKAVEGQLTGLGFPRDEKPYHPHLTLARIKDPRGKDRITDALLNYHIESDSHTVNEVLLMRSHLSSEGARYEVMGRFQLKSSAETN